MSVVIQGIDTPKTCYDCPCHDGEYGRCNITKECISDNKPQDCPLKEYEPVVHAHWIRRTRDHRNDYYDVMEYPYRCSACHEKSKESTKRCPNCGAKMDEKES